MTRRDIIFFCFGAVSVIVISILIILLPSEGITPGHLVPRVEPPFPETLEAVTLVVPSRDIPAGTYLNNVEIKEVYWPKSQAPNGAVNGRELKKLVKFKTKTPLRAHVPIEWQQLESDR